MEHGFTWRTITPLANQLEPHVFHSLLALLLLILAAWRISVSLKKAPDPLVPDPRFSIRNIFEIIVQTLYGQVRGIIGPDGDKYVWLIGGLFFYIFFCNILGIFPGFEPPTGNINTNLAMAAVVFLGYNYYGFKAHGVKYLKQFAGPVLWLAPLMFVIEMLSHMFRPMSLSIRLFGNMFGDHMVLNIFAGLVPLFIPMIFIVLGIVVSLIQAFVFAVLATVYIALAISHDH
jgi:F-type H+-transporting ATPase subunit a